MAEFRVKFLDDEFDAVDGNDDSKGFDVKVLSGGLVEAPPAPQPIGGEPSRRNLAAPPQPPNEIGPRVTPHGAQQEIASWGRGMPSGIQNRAYMTPRAVSEQTIDKRVEQESGRAENISKTIKAWEAGKLDLELMDLRAKQLMGEDSPEIRRRIAEIKKSMPSKEETTGEGLFGRMATASARMAPYMIDTAKAGGFYSMAAGAATAAFGMPELAPAAMAVVGSMAAGGRTAWLEAGGAYDELLDLKDPQTGQKIDPKVAKALAAAVGVVNGALEVGQFKILLDSVPGAKKFVSGAVRKAIIDIAKKGTLKSLALKYAGKTALGLGGEVFIEISQEASNVIANEVAKNIERDAGRANIPPATAEQIAQRFIEIAKESAYGFAPLILGGHAVQAAGDAKTILLDQGEEAETAKSILTGEKEGEQQEPQPEPVSHEEIQAAGEPELAPDETIDAEEAAAAFDEEELAKVAGEQEALAKPQKQQERPQKSESKFADLDTEVLYRRIKNIEKLKPGQRGKKQQENLESYYAELKRRGIKLAKESAEVFAEEVPESEFDTKPVDIKTAIANLTKTTGKSAEQSARDIVAELEQADRRQAQKRPRLEGIAKQYPGLVHVLARLSGIPKTKPGEAIKAQPKPLPAGQGFEVVKDNNLIPYELRPAFEVMKRDVDSGRIERNMKGHNIGSTYPKWFKRLKGEARKKAQSIGGVIPGGWSKKEFARILYLAENGKKMTPRQWARFDELIETAKKEIAENPELTIPQDINEYQKLGFEIIDKKLPVGELEKGDQVLVRNSLGGIDVLTHEGWDDKSEAVLKDGITIKADPFDQVEVLGIRRKADAEQARRASEIDNPVAAWWNDMTREGREAAAVKAYMLKDSTKLSKAVAERDWDLLPPETQRLLQARYDAEQDFKKQAEHELKKSAGPKKRKQVHDYSSTQVNLSGKVAEDVKAMAARIADEDLYEDPNDPSFGREDNPHITVKYGLHTTDPAEVRKVMQGQGPIAVTAGKVSVFKGDQYDVVKIDVDSPDLHKLNKKIADSVKHTDTHPEYKPHITLAYVKPGLGAKYAGAATLEGKEITFDKLIFSGKDGKETVIELTGDRRKVDRATPDRRKDFERRKRVDEMTPEEMRRELLTDPLTGLGNRRAYEEAERKAVQVSIDVDSLKWINDFFGHEDGDKMLRIVGDALKETGLPAYHPSGDEFWLEADSLEEVEKAIKKAYDYLKDNTIIAEKDGETYEFEVNFSYGTGETLKEADDALRWHKKEREDRGLRASRGERPPSVRVRKNAQGGEGDTSGVLQGVAEIAKGPRNKTDDQGKNRRSKVASILPYKAQIGQAAKNIGKLINDLGLQEKVLQGEDFHIRIPNPPLMDLVIERHPTGTGGQRLYLTHYRKQGGDLILDAEMVFNIHPDGRLSLAETAVENVVRGGELRNKDVSFATMFSRNLLNQGFGKVKIGEQDAGKIRSTEGKVPEGRNEPGESQRESGQNLQRPKKAGQETGDTVLPSKSDEAEGITRERFADRLERTGVAKGPDDATYSIQHSDSGGYYVRKTENGIRIEFGGDPREPWTINQAREKAVEEAFGKEKQGEGASSGFQSKAMSRKTGSSDKLANWVLDKISRGARFSWRELFKEANKAFGGTQAEGAYTPKDAYDAIELAINRYILMDRADYTPIKTAEQAKGAVEKLKRLLHLIPSQTKRTLEQEQYQQFSTPPPLAYVVNWVAKIDKYDSVLEPSAGVGGLAVFSKLATNNIVLNELSQRRADLLRILGLGEVFTENAEQIDNILPDRIRPTVVIMNPPFSATAGRLSKNKTKYGAQHIEQALARLEPGGRLVAIVGRGMADNRPGFRKWWTRIKKQYNVRANIGVSGKEYSKYGTTFDNQILVIDKTGPTTENVITGFVESVDELIDKLGGVRDDRTKANLQKTERPSGKPAGQEDNRRLVSLRTGSGRQSLGSGAAGNRNVKRSGQPSEDRSGRGLRPERSSGHRGSNIRAERPGELRPGESSRAAGSGEHAGGQQRTTDKSAAGSVRTAAGGRRTVDTTGTQTSRLKVKVNKKQPAKKQEISESLYEEYVPKAKIEGSRPHPTPLVESAAMADTEAPDPTYSPSLPDIAVKGDPSNPSVGLSDIQLEAVVYAGQAHQQKTPDGGARRGFFIGDGTGVGKGREIAGIIWDNWNQGRRKAVWISVSWDLAKDAKRDLRDAGWAEGADKLFELRKTKLGQRVKVDEGIMFVPYSTLRGGFVEKINDANLNVRVNQIKDWLGPDFDGVIVFDEAHEMQGVMPQKGKRGQRKPSQQGLAGVDLQNALPKARVVYVSATGATEVSNLAYAPRLGIWGEGTPFKDVQEFVTKVSGGGVAAMELIARNLKSLGVYLARSLSYANVQYHRLEHKIDAEQKAKYDEFAKAWQVVLENIHEAMEKTNANSAQAKLSQFWSNHQRCFNQILTTMQMPSVIKSVKKDLEDGYAVVVQLVNTDEAAQKRALGRLREDQDLDDLDITPRQALMDYIENGFPVQQYEEFEDENGNIRIRPVTDANGNPVLNREAVRIRDELLTKIGAISFPDGPLDYLISEIGADNVAEITGRKSRIVVDPKTGRKVIEKRSDKNVEAEAQDFIDDKRRVLVFSGKGGTGRSFHADKRYKNHRKRRHYLVQPGWQANKAVQGLGRSHRSNQASDPEFILVTTDIKGQKRFISTIARRLDQLGALTKGERKTGSQGIFQARDNLESEYAHEALGQYINALVRGAAQISVEEFESQTGLKLAGELGIKVPEIRQFLNRLLSMDIDTQNKVFEEFSQYLDQVVEDHARRGTLDVGIETITGEKIVKVDDEVVYEDKETGAKTRYIGVDVTTKAKVLSFEETKEVFATIGGYYRNKRSGRVWVASPERSATTSAGNVMKYRLLVSPQYTTQRLNVTDLARDTWERLEEADAKRAWGAEYDKLPKTVTRRHHMIVGNILPVWNRLQGKPTVYRMQTDDGERFIGRVIDPDAVEETLGALDIAAGRVEYKPADLVNRVLYGDAVIKLGDGWKVKKVTVSGEDRIEVTGLPYSDIDWARANGLIVERIQYQTRFFVPTDSKAASVLAKIIDRKSVISVQESIDKKIGEITFSRRKNTQGEVDVKGKPTERTRRLEKVISEDLQKEIPVGTFREQVQVRDDVAAPVQRLAGVFGKRVTFFTNSRPDIAPIDGITFGDGHIYVNAHAEKPYRVVVGHELLHELRRDHEDIYALLLDTLSDYIQNFEDYKAKLDKLTQEREGRTLKTHRVYEELIADFVGEQMTDPDFWKAVINDQKPSVAKRIIDAVKKFFTKIINWITVTAKKGEISSQYFKDIKAARQAALDALTEYRKRQTVGIKYAAAKRSETSVRYSRKESIKEQLESALPETARERIKEAEKASKKKKSFKERLAEHAAKIKASRQHFPFLESIEDKDLRHKLADILRQHQEVPEFARTKATRLVRDFIRGLDNEEYEVFRTYILLADMMRDVNKGLLDDQKLPFGFESVGQVKEAFEKVKALVDDNQKLADAIERRNTTINKIKAQLVEAKILKKETLQDEDYFHHQVLMFLNDKYGLATGSQDVRTHFRGWMAKRKGSMLDYNTDYAEVEFIVLSQQIAQLETVKTLQRIKQTADIYKKLWKQAKAINYKRLKDKLRKEGRLNVDMFTGEDLEDPLREFRRPIAVAIQKLGEMAQAGKLEYDSEWEDIVQTMIEDRRAKKELEAEDIYGWHGGPIEPRFFHFLSYLIEHKKPGSSWAAQIFKSIKARDRFIQETLGDKYVTWKNLIPEGYTIWRPQPGKAWFWANTVADNVLQKLIEGEIDPKDVEFRKILARGRDLTWVIPDGLAKTMDNFRDAPEAYGIGRAAEVIHKFWKQWMLMNPYSVVKYNINNWSGDMDAILAYAPQILKQKYAWRAGRELWRWHRGKKLDPKLEAELQLAQRLGVIGSGWAVQEVEDVARILSLDQLVRKAIKHDPGHWWDPRKWPGKYWSFVKGATAWRENILRLAAWRYFKDNADKQLYGASKPEEIDAIKDPAERAAKLARELMGDYGNISKTGEWIRKRLMPFYSWIEINAPRYVYMMRNTKYENRDAGSVKGRMAAVGARKMVMSAAKLAIRAQMLFGLVMLWNMTFFPDEEDELGESGRNQLHLILGRREDGSIISLRFQGALSDALSFFALEDWPSDLKDVVEGKATIGEKVVEAGKAFVNRAVQAVRPEPKLFTEVVTGYGTYPDVFTPRPVRDRVEAVLRVFRLDKLYQEAIGKPRRGNSVAEHLLEDLKTMLVYEADPGVQAYYETRKLVFDWLDKNGIERSYGRPTKRGNALYYYRQALRFGDLKAAKKYLDKYYELGGTPKKLRQALRLAHPLSTLPKTKRYAFRKSLSPDDAARVQRAIDWYRRTYGNP